MFHDQLDVVLLQRWSTAAQYSGVRPRKDTDPLPCRPFIDFWKFNLTLKLFLTTTPQLLIYCVLHYRTFLISADVHEVNFFHCFGCRSVNMYTSPSHCCTGPISNDDKGCFHVCVMLSCVCDFTVMKPVYCGYFTLSCDTGLSEILTPLEKHKTTELWWQEKRKKRLFPPDLVFFSSF